MIILNSTALVESRNKKNKMTNIGLILKQKI